MAHAMTRIRHLYLQAPPRMESPPRELQLGENRVTGNSRESGLDQWSASIAEEARLTGARGLLSSPIQTLLIGAGPSSQVSAGLAGRVRKLLGSDLLRAVEEWTIELSPEDLTPELIRQWRDSGVTRPNLRLLSLSEAALKGLGQRFTSESGRRAVEMLSGGGFPTWSADLLFALPVEWGCDPIRSAEKLIAAGVPHISLYESGVDGETEQFGQVGEWIDAQPGEEARAEEYLRIATFLLGEGYEPYEMTGFSLPGHASRHAVALLEGKPYLGMGPGAESFIDGRLSRNLEDWTEYSGLLVQGKLPEGESALLDSEGAHFLQIWSRLKLRAGLLRSELSLAGQELGERWVREGVAQRDSERVALTLEGWLRLDGLALEMARVEMPG